MARTVSTLNEGMRRPVVVGPYWQSRWLLSALEFQGLHPLEASNLRCIEIHFDTKQDACFVGEVW